MVVNNITLRRGLKRFSHCRMQKLCGTYKKLKGMKPKDKKKPVEDKKTKPKLDKKGLKLATWLPARHKQVLRKKGPSSKPKLRKSIVPGTVLIILAGRFAGKRVIFLKQLEKSGMLLVTGPFKVNGVPLRRVNQAYVIATSQKLDVSGIDLKTVTDRMFKKAHEKKEKKTEANFFTAEGRKKIKEEKQKKISPERKELQKTIDTVLIERAAKVELLTDYLRTAFTLGRNQFPHEMKF